MIDVTIVRRAHSAGPRLQKRLPRNVPDTDFRGLGFDVDRLVGVGVRLGVPIDPEARWLKKLLSLDVWIAAMGAAIGHLMIRAGSATLIAPPCPAQVLGLPLATVDRAKPIQCYASRFPDQTIDNDFSAGRILSDGDIGIARRALIAPITRSFLVGTKTLLSPLRLSAQGIEGHNRGGKPAPGYQ